MPSATAGPLPTASIWFNDVAPPPSPPSLRRHLSRPQTPNSILRLFRPSSTPAPAPAPAGATPDPRFLDAESPSLTSLSGSSSHSTKSSGIILPAEPHLSHASSLTTTTTSTTTSTASTPPRPPRASLPRTRVFVDRAGAPAQQPLSAFAAAAARFAAADLHAPTPLDESLRAPDPTVCGHAAEAEFWGADPLEEDACSYESDTEVYADADRNNDPDAGTEWANTEAPSSLRLAPAPARHQQTISAATLAATTPATTTSASAPTPASRPVRNSRGLAAVAVAAAATPRRALAPARRAISALREATPSHAGTPAAHGNTPATRPRSEAHAPAVRVARGAQPAHQNVKATAGTPHHAAPQQRQPHSFAAPTCGDVQVQTATALVPRSAALGAGGDPAAALAQRQDFMELAKNAAGAHTAAQKEAAMRRRPGHLLSRMGRRIGRLY